jgi:ribonucleoside-diphosphate reductase subunit M1
MYYLRTKPAAQAIQFTVDKTKIAQMNKAKTESGDKSSETKQEENMSAMVCSLQNKDDCLMCGS